VPLPHAALYAGPVQTIAKDHEMTKTTDTETEANRQMMTETFEAWRDGAEPFPDTWASDMVWRIEGHSIASKEYASKHEYLEEFVNPSARAS
jgi:ketosteroid isomerase-like protein